MKKRINMPINTGTGIVVLLLYLVLLQSCSYGSPTKGNKETVRNSEQDNNPNNPLAVYNHVYSFKEGFAIVAKDKKT